jgi:hypothetical protein
MLIKVKITETGNTEYFRSKAALENALPVSPTDWGLIVTGKTVKMASFLGQVEVTMVKK